MRGGKEKLILLARVDGGVKIYISRKSGKSWSGEKTHYVKGCHSFYVFFFCVPSGKNFFILLLFCVYGDAVKFLVTSFSRIPGDQGK